MKTIYNTYVEMESQEQCDRMKQLCIDNGLKIWDYFYFTNNSIFEVENDTKDFYIVKFSQKEQLYKITEQEFIKLLKNE